MRITIRKIYAHLYGKIIYTLLDRRKNIILQKSVIFKNKPIIEVHKNARLIIGNNVTINSDNNGYHLNMFSPCKLMADKPGAIIEIGDNTRVHGSCIHAYSKVTIGKNCLIAANCQIMDGNGHDLSFPITSNRIYTKGDIKEVIIEDNVWLGTGVIVLPGVRIGQGSIISANSVVHMDIPTMVVAGGNPVKVIKSYEEPTNS